MEHTINDAALHILLATPRGALAQDIERRANAMLQVYEERARQIFENRTGIQGDRNVEMRPDPDGGFLIGFVDGSIERYLAPKIASEPDKILPQLDAAFRAE